MIIPVLSYAQSPSPSVGLRFVPPYQRSQLAVGVQTASLASGSFVVVDVENGSPASLAGIRVGDVVTAVNGKRVCQGDDLTTAISSAGVGTEATITFVRGDDIRTAKVRVANRSEFDPTYAATEVARTRILAEWERKDYKGVINACKVIPEPKQALVDTSCALAQFNHRDVRKGIKLFEYAEAVCPQCPEIYADHASALKSFQMNYGDTWAKAVRTMDELSAFQSKAFGAMDLRVAMEVKQLAEKGQPDKALDQYALLVKDEVGCRGVPPSPLLADIVNQLKAKVDPTLALPEAAARSVTQARTAAQVAKTPQEMVKAQEKWIGVTWLAPWWGEGYTNAADLLDGLGFPDQALALGKRAANLPRAKTVAVAQAAPAAEEPITDPVDTLRKCINGLSTAEKGSPEGQRLRLRAIAAALKMSPPPDAPMEARRLVARGQAGIEMAQSKTDFADAASEFEKAILIAPWWAEAYKGLGLANEKAANYRQAMVSYDLYTKAAPNAPDVNDIQNKIFKLEYAADRDEKQSFDRVIAAKTANARMLALQGLWRERDNTRHLWQVTLQNGMLIATRPGITEDNAYHNGQYTIKASIKGAALDGTLASPPMQILNTGCDVQSSEQPLTGTIGEDGKTITVKYQQAVYTTQHIKANLFNVARCLKVEKLRDDMVTAILEKQ